MNFGEKLKQIRTERNMTQPQMAEAIGIEQSYLSKLENEKSVPSAEMFQAIMRGLTINAKDFLNDIDGAVLNGPLKQIPEVANFLSSSETTKVHNAKNWMIASTAACIFGFGLMFANFNGIFFSNWEYQYKSEGVILPNESDEIFEQFPKLVALKIEAKTLTQEQGALALAEFESTRKKTSEIISNRYQGIAFMQNVENGQRRYSLQNKRFIPPLGNKILHYLGTLILIAGVAGFIIEWRLRRIAARSAK